MKNRNNKSETTLCLRGTGVILFLGNPEKIGGNND